MKTRNIRDNMIYATDKSFTLGLEDSQHQFGVLFDIVDMQEATGEPEFDQYPFIVSASIMVNNPHESFADDCGLSDGQKLDRLDLIAEVSAYMGGVPVDHVLTDEIQHAGSVEIGSQGGFAWLANGFKVSEAMVKTQSYDFGTVAAQRGKGVKASYLQFKTEAAARKYVKMLVNHRLSALSMLIGFILDRPVNMIGDTGWETIRAQVNGKNAA